MDGVRPSAIRELLKLGADPEVISFGGGYPDARLFPMQGLQQVYSDLLDGADPSVLQYTTSDGLMALRTQVAARMSRGGAPTDPADVLVLHGAQQGLDLVAKLMLDPGDTIITENPTFVGALVAFNPYEPTYAGVEMDNDGMIMEDLERALFANPRTKFIYTIPDFQNPTGVTLSLPRRRRLIELANQFDVIVLEDSPYRELRYTGAHLPTLKSLDTEDRVVHLGSFSKILAPGMRLGWVAASPEIINKLTMLKMAADTQSSTLNMAAAAAFLERFDIDAHIRHVVVSYERKRDLMLGTIADSFPASVTMTNPEGGLFTWLTWPDGFDTEEFMRTQALPLAKVAFVPGASFFPVEQQRNHARFNFSGLDDEKIVSGIARLGRLLEPAWTD
jgi:2-aminoadipate transaminase